jgi:DNA (cytosine-5)-methyltransferase 1
MDLGAEESGFARVVWAIDNGRWAVDTYRGKVGTYVVEGDIRDLEIPDGPWSSLSGFLQPLESRRRKDRIR